ncbi:MAG: cobyric acid synthase [Chlorobium sp.]|nr:cobyric acid synthase [Chlorobium sp.]MCW8819350.1 cobyric acid synthase [Ignavibacteriaceae bacterium]
MRNLAVFGTASDVGKSVVATALCRIFSNAGLDVAPFKAQNMSNNSGVTPDGLEIGRAQIVQAEAARAVPTADMNPVLLKPNTDTGAQVVLQGKAVANRSARDYFGNTEVWAEAAFESLERLKGRHDLVVIEGAGSCAEMNLYDRDFVNFRTAKEADAPVILVADIDRGGVFAQVAGTLSVIPPEDRARVKGVIINRFRGDSALFDDGIRILEELSGVPVLGVIPYFRGIHIEAEDAVPLQAVVDPAASPDTGKISIAIVYFPHISNFTDFAVFDLLDDAEVHYLHHPKDLADYEAVILPGSKNVRGDLDWMISMGWKERLAEYRKRGGIIAGICGGYQMLGISVADPHGLEGEPGETSGLGLLPVHTVLKKEKQLFNAKGCLFDDTIPVEGYEIHMGETRLTGKASPLLQLTARNNRHCSDTDGVISHDEKVFGTYFHGIFDGSAFRRWFLGKLRPDYTVSDTIKDKDAEYNRLADHFMRYLDMEKVYEIIGRQRGEG